MLQTKIAGREELGGHFLHCHMRYSSFITTGVSEHSSEALCNSRHGNTVCSPFTLPQRRSHSFDYPSLRRNFVFFRTKNPRAQCPTVYPEMMNARSRVQTKHPPKRRKKHIPRNASKYETLQRSRAIGIVTDVHALLPI